MSDPRRSVPLYLKFVVPIILVLLASAAIVTWQIIHREEERLRSSLGDKGATIAQYLAASAEFGVVTGDNEILAGVVDTTLRVKDVVFAEIRDVEGNVLAKSGESGGHRPEELLIAAVPVTTQRVTRVREELGIFSEGAEESPAVVPPSGGEEAFIDPGEPGSMPEVRVERIGSVQVGLSTREAAAAIRKNRNAVLTVTVLLVAALSGIMAILVRLVTNPLKRLVGATKKIAAGDLDECVGIASRDEIGELAVSFNHMVSDLKGSIGNLHRISEFSQAMLPPKDINALVGTITERFTALEGVNRAVVLIYDRETDEFRPVAGKEEGFLCPAGAATGLFEAGDLVRLRDQTGGWENGLRGAGADALMPLMSKDARVGIVALGLEAPDEEIPGREADLLRTYASIAAMAIENLQLLRIKTENEILRLQLKFAQDIQMQLLPRDVPRVKGLSIHSVCLPAKDLGGDYYDFIPLDCPDRLGLTIADVAGKGVPAALYMASSRSLLRAEAARHATPGGVLASLNRFLYRDMKEKTFVSMFYGVFDPRGRVMQFANAGHVSPILRRGNGGGRSFLESPGFPLGITGDITYPDIRVELAPGDIIILYTDGVVEAMNGERELFGFERLEEVLRGIEGDSPRDIVQEIMGEVRGFIGEEPLADDLTLIAVRVD